MSLIQRGTEESEPAKAFAVDTRIRGVSQGISQRTVMCGRAVISVAVMGTGVQSAKVDRMGALIVGHSLRIGKVVAGMATTKGPSRHLW